MSLPVPSSMHPLLAGYLILFSAAALGCLAGAWRARQVESRGVRRGLIGLLGTSGLWAGAHVGMLLAPTLFLEAWVYDVGLIVGFATVGAWLWFCSSYSGRQFHRSRGVQWGGFAIFAMVTLTKLTNPWHGLYFTAGWHPVPFQHIQIDHHALYWGTAALSYAGAAVGFFMLYEPLRRARVGSGRLAGLFGLTALPLLANGLGYLSPSLLDVSHEPVGMAAFAIGVLFVYRDQFEATGQAGRREKPTLILSEENRIRNYNGPAAALFPALEDEEAVGTDLSALLPEVAEALAGEAETLQGGAKTLQVEEEGATRHYRPAESTFGRGSGRRVAFADVTERALRRRVRDQEHRFLAEAVGQAKEAVLVTEAAPLDEPGPRIVYANEAFEEMTGYAEEEVLGKTPRLLQGPETDRAVLDSLRAALEAGDEWEGETINYCKGGEPYRVQWNISPVRGVGGQIEHWISVQRDVTEERKREEALRRQKNLLGQTQRLAGAWEVNLQAGEMSWSDKVYEIHELDPSAELTTEESFQFCAPEAHQKVQEAFEQCAEEGEPYDLELPIVTAEGNRRWVRTVGAPAETEAGEVTKVAGAFQDITERKEAERELRRSQERLQMATEAGNVGTWNWDLDTGRVVFNDQWAEMLGYSREELDFQFSTWEELVHPEDLPRAKEALERYIERDEGTYAPEIRMRTKSGDWKWIQTVGKVVERGSGGAVTRAAGVHLDIDERKRRERRLQQAETLFHNAQDALFLIDVEGNHRGEDERSERTFTVRRVNPAYEEATGLSEEDIRGRSPQEVFGREAGQHIERRYRECARRREPIEYNKEFPLGDRVTYWTTRIAPVVVEGEVEQIVGTTRNVTEQRRRKQRLERQNDLFERAQQIADVGAWEYDVQSEESTLTEQAYRIHGLAPASGMTPEKSLEFYHAEDRPTIRQAFTRAVEEGTPYDLEARLTGDDGKERWVRTRGEPQREEENPEGDVARVRGTIQDITARKERERAFRERQDKVESLYEGTNQLLRSEDKEAVGSCLVGLIDETFDFAGTAVRYVEGNPKEGDPVEGDPVEEGQLVPAKLSDTLQAHMPERLPYDLEGDSPVAETYRSGQAQVYDDLRDVESAVNRGDVRAAAYVPMGSHGTLSVGSLQAEGIEDFDRRLIEVLAGYAALVLDRLEREEALLAAKEEAEKANRMKSSFLANMSHEIRTPLTSIIGFAETAGTEASELELSESSPLPKYTELIERGGKRLLDTLEGVLNLSKLEAGQMELGQERVDLEAVAEQTVEEFRPKIEEGKVDVRLETDSATARADQGGVQIVVQNLVSNAIKYTDEGEVNVRTYRENGEVALEVEDTGIGMEPEATDRLFKPFRQASEGFSREYEGTGVGLAVTKKATEQMGGTLECETEKGEGSRFTARFPRAGDAEADSRDA